MYKPSELMLFLNQLGIYPKKGLSQNFLVDGNIIRKIAQTAQVEKEDVVVEIGPGPGALTQELVKSGGTVLAVEKDPVLAQALERFKSSEHLLEIFCDDILNFPLSEALKQRLKPGQKAKVIANLPYHLTTPILVNLLQMEQQISTLVLMVQDEVALRLTASPGSHHYSSMTVFLNFYCQASYAFKVSRHCFYPQPSVDSAVIMLQLKTPTHVSNQEQFFKMTRTAFGQRRKMMRASLKELYKPEAIIKTLSEIGQNPQARPEELSLQDFVNLFERLQKS